jgi:hypothetical protein
VATATDARVLVFHDGSRPETVVCVEISCEGGHGGHADDDFELLAVLICLYAAISNGGSDFVPDWVLSVVCCGDEELVFNIDEVLSVADDFDIGICNGVLDY